MKSSLRSGSVLLILLLWFQYVHVSMACVTLVSEVLVPVPVSLGIKVQTVIKVSLQVICHF